VVSLSRQCSPATRQLGATAAASVAVAAAAKDDLALSFSSALTPRPLTRSGHATDRGQTD